MQPAQVGALWPLAAYFVGVAILVAGMMGLSFVLGERHRANPFTDRPYESGIVPTGSARGRQSIQFYLVAMFFVIFDLEAVFIFAWAIALRDLGWSGFLTAAIFIAVMLAGLAYLWRLGALDWGTSGHRAGRRRSRAS